MARVRTYRPVRAAVLSKEQQAAAEKAEASRQFKLSEQRHALLRNVEPFKVPRFALDEIEDKSVAFKMRLPRKVAFALLTIMAGSGPTGKHTGLLVFYVMRERVRDKPDDMSVMVLAMNNGGEVMHEITFSSQDYHLFSKVPGVYVVHRLYDGPKAYYNNSRASLQNIASYAVEMTTEPLAKRLSFIDFTIIALQDDKKKIEHRLTIGVPGSEQDLHFRDVNRLEKDDEKTLSSQLLLKRMNAESKRPALTCQVLIPTSELVGTLEKALRIAVRDDYVSPFLVVYHKPPAKGTKQAPATQAGKKLLEAENTGKSLDVLLCGTRRIDIVAKHAEWAASEQSRRAEAAKNRRPFEATDAPKPGDKETAFVNLIKGGIPVKVTERFDGAAITSISLSAALVLRSLLKYFFKLPASVEHGMYLTFGLAQPMFFYWYFAPRSMITCVIAPIQIDAATVEAYDKNKQLLPNTIMAKTGMPETRAIKEEKKEEK